MTIPDTGKNTVSGIAALQGKISIFTAIKRTTVYAKQIYMKMTSEIREHTGQRYQTTSHLMMVRPVRFGFNEQTADSNAFQQKESTLSQKVIQQKAQQEFDAFVSMLREAGIRITVFEDTPEPHTPDSIFPNNWITLHENGNIILYPMFAPNRRLERRDDIVAHFVNACSKSKLIDWSGLAEEGLFLEGTGSMTLDREYQIAYACVSPRTTPELFDRFCQELGCREILFHANDQNGVPIYHTNVMMALGSSLTVICLESITDQAEREKVLTHLEATGKTVLAISFEQMNSFAGNMLEVYNDAGKTFWIMSQRAFDSLNESQRETIGEHGEIIAVPLDVIETYGGGSVRCMMAEVFLPC